jgi:acyl-CoA thioester hydrolase
MEHQDYKLSLELRIDFSDLDLYRHVNNLTFIRFMQSGRVNLWEVTGLSEMFDEQNKGAILVSSHCDFKKSLYYPGTAIVKTKVAFLKNSSFGIDHIILNNEGDVCATGHDVAACYDFNINTTFSIPAELRVELEKY